MQNNISKEIFKKLDEAKELSTNDPKKSYILSEEAFILSKENNLKSEEAYSLLGMSFACRAMSLLNKWLNYSFSALEIFDDLQDIYGQIRALNLIGIAYFYHSMYEQALKYLLRSLTLLENYKDDFLLTCVLNNIGEVHRESGENHKAIEYYNEALKICIEMNLEINIISLFNNIGEVYFTEKKYDKAMEYYNKSYNMLSCIDDIVLLGEVENKLGKINHVLRDCKKAKEYFHSSLKRLESVNNMFYAIDTLVNLGELEIEEKSSKAIEHFERAIGYAEETNAKKKLSMIYKTLADFYEKKGNYKFSLEYFKKYHLVQQEVASSLVSNKLEIIKIEVDHLKTNHEIEKFKMINERLEAEISNQRGELEKTQQLALTLEETALIDELTTVPNRRYINNSLKKTLEECPLLNESIALFIIDIDKFKFYNDSWGHLEGDKCLVKIANSIIHIQETRNDVFGRYGGEEFIYYSKNIDYEEACSLGDKIRNEVEKLNLKYSDDENSKIVTISIGGIVDKISSYSNISNLINLADKELYKVKNMGRNMVSIQNNL